MRGIVCCLLLSSCTLDTTPSVGPWEPDAGSQRAWMPRDAPEPKTRIEVASGKAGVPSATPTVSGTSASKPNPMGAATPSSSPAAAASATPAGSASSGSMPAPPDPAPDDPPRPAQPSPLIDAGANPAATDVGGAGPTLDASLADAASPEELLSWFGVRTTAAQRVLLSALFDDLTGRQRADRDNLVSILNSFNDFDCVLNAQLCVQICVWAASRCDICTDDTCVGAMQARCGFDCGGP